MFSRNKSRGRVPLLRSLLIAGAGLLLLPAGAFAQYAGRVVTDTNRNGVWDAADGALAGVAVTDGCNVVLTDADGRFTLPGYARTRFVSVTTPAGYAAQPYYLPVSDSLPSYDFLLTADDRSASADHSFLQITDTEIFNRGADERWCSYLRDYIAAERPAFLVHTGDICYPSGLRQHIRSVNRQTMGCPVYYMPGNHDLVEGAYGEQLFESIYGPSWYSFDAGRVHYVVTPMAYGDHAPGFTPGEVLRWLANDLRAMKPGQVLVLFNHDFPAPDGGLVLSADGERVDLKEHDLRAWVYGHMHYNHTFRIAGVPVVCTSTPDKGGIDHSASAFRRFDMTADGIGTHRLKYTCLDRQAVVALPAAGEEPLWTPDGKIRISVNASYSGAETRGVSVVLNDLAGGRKSVGTTLAPRGCWNWSGEIALPGSWQGREVELTATVRFSDGTQTTACSRFWAMRATAPTVRTGAAWRSLGGNARHCVQPDSCGSGRVTARVAWTNYVGSVFMSSPLIADGRVYVATCDDNGPGDSAVCALDAATGEVVWRFQTRAPVKNSIAYDAGSVAAQDALGNLYIIDGVSGRLRWERPLIDGGYPYLSEGLVAEAGIVYAGCGASLCACRIDTGELLWTNPDRTVGGGSSTTLTLCDGVLVSSGQWTGLYGHDAATGKQRWFRNADGLRDRSGSAVYKDGSLCLISGKSLFVLDPATGEVLSRKSCDDFSLDAASCPLFADDVVIFGTAAKGLLAVDRRTHDVRWNLTTGTSLVFTAPYTSLPAASVETSAVLKGGVAWFGASDGCLYGVDPVTGKVLWTFRSGAPFLSSPAVSGNLLVAADFAGNIYGICIE